MESEAFRTWDAHKQPIQKGIEYYYGDKTLAMI